MTEQYEVIAGNVGTVYSGTDKLDAVMTWLAYADKSARGDGRVAHEPVTMLCNGETVKEHIPFAEDLS